MKANKSFAPFFKDMIRFLVGSSYMVFHAVDTKFSLKIFACG